MSGRCSVLACGGLYSVTAMAGSLAIAGELQLAGGALRMACMAGRYLRSAVIRPARTSGCPTDAFDPTGHCGAGPQPAAV